MGKIGTSCAIFKDIMGMYLEEEKALAIHDVIEMPTHNGFTKAEMLNVIKWLWHQKYRLDDEPMTNADRIRNMTDGELAEFMNTVRKGYAGELVCDADCYYCGLKETTCKRQILKWLQSEVKEGNSDENT